MANHTLNAKQIGEAMLRLERLTRDCFEIARNYWGKRETEPSIEYRVMENAIRDSVAKCLSEILISVVEDDLGCVFFAPRYRGVGALKNQPGVASKSAGTHLPLFNQYTENFGCLAERGELVQKLYFMPAAFWNYYIYEVPLIFQDAETLRPKQVRLSGFSGWTAEHGFLEHGSGPTKAPVCGFHFTFDGAPDVALTSAQFRDGFLDIVFPQDTPCFGVTAAFRSALYDGRNAFYHGGTSRPRLLARNSANEAFDPPFPVISGSGTPLQGLDGTIAEAIFSTLFYSNFHDLPFRPMESDDWNSMLTSIGVAAIPPVGQICSFADIGAFLFDQYRRSARDAVEAKDQILTFPHYYAFLLNRSLEFKASRHIQTAAIGTLNLHTRSALLPPLPGLIRKNLESIYYFLRVLEDWEDATREGGDTALDLMNQAMGHEVVKTYSTAHGLLTAQRTGAESPACELINNITEMTLEYGILWGSGSDVSIPKDAQLWDDHGEPFKPRNYIAAWARQSWRLFLVTNVLRGLNSPLTSGDHAKVSALWKAAEKLSDYVYFEERTSLIFPPAFDRDRRQREALSRALYRWMMAVMSNAWKHLVLMSYSVFMSDIDKTPLFMKTIPERLDPILNDLTVWNSVGSAETSVPISVLFTGDEGSIVTSVSNRCVKQPPKIEPKSERTYLAMIMAGQDIWKAQGEACSVALIRSNMRFEFDFNDGRWISAMRIPKVIIQGVEDSK